MGEQGRLFFVGGFAVSLAVVATGCAEGDGVEEAELRQVMADAASLDPDSLDADALDEAASMFEMAEDSGASTTSFDPCSLTITRTHQVQTSDGATLELIEKFTPSALFRYPRRSILMLPGTLVTADLWNMDVGGSDTYNALDRAAQEGYFAFAVTYQGYPGSSLAADGKDVTADVLLDQSGEVIEWIRQRRHVPEVDLLGASLGSSLAIALGGDLSPIDPAHVGGIVLTALVYKSVRPEFAETFFSPEILELFLTAPNGYIQTAPELYGAILALAEPDAAAEAAATWPGSYAVGPTLEGFVLPVFDGQYGRARALQVWGTADPITPLEDAQTFQSEYAGPVQLAQIPGGGHAMHLEATRDAQWNASFEFLDEERHDFFLVCAP